MNIYIDNLSTCILRYKSVTHDVNGDNICCHSCTNISRMNEYFVTKSLCIERHITS